MVNVQKVKVRGAYVVPPPLVAFGRAPVADAGFLEGGFCSRAKF